MTLDQTRQLGIEFERRVQTMIPQKEFTEKLDTETIYSFLNQYQDKFIRDIYNTVDKILSPSNQSTYINTILNPLLTKTESTITKVKGNKYFFALPNDFGLYINSFTDVNYSYGYKKNNKNSGILSNILISQSELSKYEQIANDKMRILRNPIAYFDSKNLNSISIIFDMYTNPKWITLYYYKLPNYMDIIKSVPCELPIEAFEALVSGAVDLYVEYVAGAEERRRKQIAQANQRAREDERDAKRNGNNDD